MVNTKVLNFYKTLSVLAALNSLVGCAVRFNYSIEPVTTNSTASGSNTSTSTSISESSAQLTVTYPDPVGTWGTKTSWIKKISGTCSNDGKLVILFSGTTALGQATCTSNLFSFYADTSSLGVATHALTLVHYDDASLAKSITLTLVKETSACDSAATRAKNLAAGLGGGAGSSGSPYLVCTTAQLAAISGGLSNSYAVASDLYFETGDTDGDWAVTGADADYTSGAGWTPITTSFSGNFNGNSYVINGLRINLPTTDNVGIFSFNKGRSDMNNIYLYDAQVTGQDNTGAVVGRFEMGDFRNNHCISCVVSGRTGVGGLVGEALSGFGIQLTFQGGSVTGTVNYTGGVVGTSFIPLSGLKNSGTINGSYGVGGIVGYSSNATRFAINTGSVTGTSTLVGGIVGRIYSPVMIEYAYNTGNITGQNWVGGITSERRLVQRVFSTGNVTATGGGNAGPVIGANCCGAPATLTEIYYLTSVTCTVSAGSCNSLGTAEATLSNFYSKSASPLLTWDFIGSTSDGRGNYWHEVEGAFPKLWWEIDYTESFSFSGEGTVVDPYLISTATELSEIVSNPKLADKYFSLQNNIDLSSLGSFEPIFLKIPFKGNFDGNFYEIQNFTYSDTEVLNVGLFGGITNGGVVTQLKVTGASVTGNASTGVLAGHLGVGGTVSKSMSSGSVTSTSSVGGLVGSAAGTISQSMSSASVSASGDGGGGLTGNAMTLSLITDSYAVGDVTCGSNYRCGGFVGIQLGVSSLLRSYASGNVVANSTSVGGFIGQTYGSISGSFSIGNVTGVSAVTDVGPLFGGGAVSNSYYWSGSTCSNTGAGAVCNSGGTGSYALKSDLFNVTNAPLNTWDFSTVWVDNSPGAPPTLIWE